MIRCVRRRSPFDPSKVDVWEAPWAPGSASVEALTPEVLRGVRGVVVRRNGRVVAPGDYGRTLADGDVVEWSLDPGFEVTAAGLQLFGFNILGGSAAAGSAASAGFSIAGPAGAASATAGAVGSTISTLSTVAAVGNFVLTTAVTSILGGLLKEKPPKPGEEDSPTYGFSGINQNPAYAGAAMPWVGGEMRVAGPIINLWTTSLADQDEHLNMVVLLAGHQVERIGDKTADGGPFTVDGGDLPLGLEINGEPADSYEDVEAWVRLGGSNQAIIPGFAQPVLQYTVDREVPDMDDPPSAGGEQAPGSYEVGDAEIDAWDTPVGVTTEVEADSFNLLLSFPRGLFTTSGGSATLQTRTLTFQVRYRRATNGTAIGDYVILPSFQVSAKTARPFTFPYAQEFIDPLDYTAPTLGEYLDLSPGPVAFASTGSQTLSSDPASESEVTIAAWINTDISTAGGTEYVIRHFASSAGFGLFFNEGTTGTFLDTSIGFTFGDGSASSTVTTDFHKQLKTFDGTQWAHLAVTYKANAQENGDSLVRFYVNGILIHQETPTQQLAWPTTSILIGAQNGAGTNHLDGGIDEMLVYERELSPIEIAALYNGGAPPPVAASATGLVAGWHFDAETSGGGATPDFVGSADATLSNLAAISTGSSGVVYLASDGTRLKDRYFIEIQRITAEENDDFAGDTAVLRSIQLTQYDEFQYPGQALLAVRVKASGQLSSQPSVTVPVRGYKCPVWDGGDEDNPNITYQWTRNPAWVLAGAATDVKLGAGASFTINDLDLGELYDWASYCDDLVPANEDRDTNGDPTPHYLGILKIEADTAAAAIVDDAKFVNGRIQLELDNAAWPDTYPPEFPESVLEEDAEWWFKLENVSYSGSPTWLTDLEGQTLPVGHVVWDSAGGVGGGGGGGQGAFEVWLHPPADPGSNDTWTPGTGETPTIQRYERRMECDIVFDRTDFPQWEALRTIAKSARAEPLKIGGKLSVFWDAPRDTTNILQTGNMVEGTFATTYAGIADRPNVLEGYFLDRTRNHERVPITMKHSTVVNPTQLAGVRIAQESFEGITRRTQVERQLLYKLNYYYLSRRLVEAVGGPDQLAVSPGNVIGVSNDVTGWGKSGRLFQNSANATTVYLDQPVTLESGSLYKVALRDSGTNTIEIRTVTSTAGVYQPGDSLTLNNPFTFTPQEDDLYLFGETDKTHMNFLVVRLETDARTLSRRFLGVQYDSQVYDAAWGTLPSPITNLTDPAA